MLQNGVETVSERFQIAALPHRCRDNDGKDHDGDDQQNGQAHHNALDYEMMHISPP